MNNDSHIQHKVETMLAMQDSMNAKVHRDWIAQNFAWYRAAWIECGELMDHHGYKWWKKQSVEAEQVKLEVIDIWHFGMSALFAEGLSRSAMAANVTAEIVAHRPNGSGVLEATEALAEYCLANKGFSVAVFWQLLDAAGLNLESLYQAYVVKNVLNFFRQDHGYKEGTYIKQWQGREDNEHLSDILATLDSDSDGFREQVYRELASRYERVGSSA